MSLELFHHSRHKKSRNLNLEIIPLSSHFLSLVSEHLRGGKPIPQMCGKMQDSLRTGLELVPEPKALCSRCVQRDSHPQALLPGLLLQAWGPGQQMCCSTTQEQFQGHSGSWEDWKRSFFLTSGKLGSGLDVWVINHDMGSEKPVGKISFQWRSSAEADRKSVV